MYFSHSDIFHESDKRRMNNASGLSPFFLVDGCKAFSAWMESIAPREESNPSPPSPSSHHDRPGGRSFPRPPGLPPMFPINVTRRGIGCGKDFSIFPLYVQCRTRRCHSSASKRPLGPFPLLPLCAASRWKRRRRGGGE